MPSTLITSAAQLSNALHGRLSAPAAPAPADADMEDSDEGEEQPPPRFPARPPAPAPRATSTFTVMVVLEQGGSTLADNVLPLSALSVLELTSNAYEQEYPHVTAIHASQQLAGFEK
ncbi:hypothetical protein TeGR_g1993, partial [Tetraparma gracilis]